LRKYGGGLDVRAIQAFDIALYGPNLAPGDCVVAISHRGTKRYTARALERARAPGCRTALVTGEGGSGRADAVFETVGQEKSAAHTVSYTGAISVLAYLAGRIGYHRTGLETLPEVFLRDECPAALRGALGTEERVKSLARKHVGRRRIWLLGAVRAP
jgi:glucosamine--fructose-6-phosphate aminotransferase (isomerizing)